MKRGGLHLRHMHFNPRSPRGGATQGRQKQQAETGYFNPRSPRGGATMPAFHNFLDAVISIHAPHEGERRFIDGHWIHTIFDFNPRSPRGGATSSATVKQSRGIFQSTLPTRGSDELMLRLSLNIREFQSTLPTRGSDLIQLVWDYHSDISIHAPHEGERLLPIGYLDISPTISIHAPHEGERHYFAVDDYYVQFISIHAPHEGERLLAPASFNVFIVFQSTLPTRGSDSGKVHLYTAFPRIC